MYIQQKLALKWKSLLSLTTLSGTLALGLSPALAGPTPLTSATLRKVVNQVELLLKTESMRRNARVNDRLTNSGDQIETKPASRAELKFNDGTVAKVGELATFRFTPNTRRFDLGNGTYLFLVPPGRGSTEFYTPNAKAGVRGSALFIRYNRETDTTIMGALTNNPLGPMDITTGGQRQDLYAGQMATVVKNRIIRVESFDLSTFLSTSPLYRDIDTTDPDLQAVRQEVSDAVNVQVAGSQPIVPAIAVVAPASPSKIDGSDVSRVTNLISPNVALVRKPLNAQASDVQSDKPSVPQSVQSPIVKLPPSTIQEPTIQEPKVSEPPVVKATPQPIQQNPTAEPPVVRANPRPITDPNADGHGHVRTYVTVIVDSKPVVYLSIDGVVDYSTVIVNPPAPVQASPVVEAVRPAPVAEVVKPSSVRVESVTPLPLVPSAVRTAPSVVVEPPARAIEAPTRVIEAPARVIEAPARVIEAPARVTEIVPPVIATPVPATTTIDVFSPSVVPATNRVIPVVVPVLAPVATPASVIVISEPVVRPTAPAITAPPIVVADPVVRPTAPAITVPPVVVADPVVRATAPAITAPPLVPASPVTPTPSVTSVAPIAPSVPIVTPIPIEPVVPVVIPTAPILAPPVAPIVPAAPIVPVAPTVPVIIQAPIVPVVPIVPVTIQAPIVPEPVVLPVVPVTPPVVPVVVPATAPAAPVVVPAAPATSVTP